MKNKKSTSSKNLRLTKLVAASLGLAVTGLATHSVHAQVTWTNTDADQEFDNTNNYTASPNGQNLIINNVTDAIDEPILDSVQTITPVDIFVGRDGGEGRFDVTAGSGATGNGNWMFVGSGAAGAIGTFNIADTTTSGGTFTGFGTGSGSFNVGGATQNGRLTIGDNNVGNVATLNVNTTGTVTANEGIGLLVGTNGANGTVNFDAGTINSTDAWFGDNGADSSGTLNMSGGALNTNQDIWVGRSGGTGEVNQTGGTVTNTRWVFVGNGGGSTGTYNANGGTLNAGDELNVGDNGGTGDLNIGGGQVNVGLINLGRGNGGTGTTTITSGGFSITGNLNLGVGDAGASGTVNLNGGTITASAVTNGPGSGTFNFNGGTLRAAGTNANFMEGLTAANVMAGGAVIDTNTFDITINQQLLDGSGGDLTKNGTGTLTLTANNQYSGDTIVNDGTLSLGDGTNNTTLDDLAMVILNGSTSIIDLNFLGTDQIGGLEIDGVVFGPGTYGSGDSGQITGAGSLLIVPEPGSLAMLLSGAGVLGLFRRRRS